LIPKIVIDTNIYISAIFWGGKPREVVDLGRSGDAVIFTSFEIEKEIASKLKDKFKLSERETAQILADFTTFTSLVNISCDISIITDDPEDNKFVECAVSSNSGFIVTGDKHLLRLKQYKSIKILKAAEFLSIL
jgi:uncharacterized protein